MKFNVAMRPSSRLTGKGPRFSGILAIAIILFSSRILAQQSASSRKEVPQTAKIQSHFPDVEELLRQGLIEQAKEKIQDELQRNPSSVEGYNLLGIIYSGQKDYAKALEAFQYALKLEPSSTRTRNNLGNVYVAEEKSDLAEKEFRTVLRLDPANRDGNYNLGLVLMSEGHPAEAVVHFQRVRPANVQARFNLIRALKLKPDSPESLYLLAQVYADEMKAVDALDLLVRAHKLAPQNTDIIFLLARVSMSQNYFEDAIPLLESGLKIAPQRADLHAALGESYFMSGKAERAIEEFKTLIQLDPSPPSYAFMGLSYRHLGRFDEARRYFQEGLKKDPRNASCLFNMGYIEERQGNHARAEELFQQALRSNRAFYDALLELANLRIANKRLEEAAELLRRYVKVSRIAASGYYKLTMVERSLHQLAAAQRDLNVFQTLSKDASSGPYPYQHLFDYLDNRSNLSPQARTQLDLTELTEQIQKHPDQPQDLYLLAETYLKLGKLEDARKTIAQLDQLSSGDYRTQTGAGVLLARYRLYDDAIQHFQSALRANPDSDDVKFDLTDAYFRKGLYAQALEAAQQVSPAGQQDDTYLALLGDIEAHLGDTTRAKEIFQEAIHRNPDNDQYYLSLTLVELRQNNVSAAEETSRKGLARIPSSGKILWGLGIVSAMEGKTPQAAENFERAVDLLPEWPGSYSTLGVFYYQTGEITKAREVLNRFKGSNAAGGLDVNRIEEALAKAPVTSSSLREPMPMIARQQLLQLALSLADRTL